MKKIFFPLMFAAVTFIAPPAMADDDDDDDYYYQNRGGFSGGFSGNGGFSGGGNQVSTVREALRMRDDQYVTLTGYIVRQIDDDDYIFQDSTGSIRVEIDDDDWRGIRANPQTKLTITGEIDRDDGRNTVDVDYVRLAGN